MTKYEKASEDVESLFDSIRNKTSIPQWIVFEVLCNNKQKSNSVKIVKTNDLTGFLTDGVDFAVTINEEIFQQLPANLQEMAIDEALAGVAISETDALSLAKPDFCTHSGVLHKYGNDVMVMHESEKSLYDKKKQEEDEKKAQAKSKKGEKKKKAFSN
jgi:hypothetical protein